MQAIEIDGVSKYYKSKLALDQIGLNVCEGEFMGFIGPNGAGKTTTINILSNFIYPSVGEARILGKSVSKEAMAIHRFTGFMGSEDFLYEDSSAIENMRYMASLKGVKNALPQIRRFADTLELDLRQRVKKLSKGNKRKISLINAIINRPKILVMDEISTGLDPVMKDHIFSFLRELNQSEGTSILFSSHILSEVEELCHRVTFIKQGRIIRTEKVAQLGQILFLLEIREPEDFAKLEVFLKKRKEVQDLELNFPQLRFYCKDSKLTHVMEKAQLFSAMDQIEIRRDSLEQATKADYR